MKNQKGFALILMLACLPVVVSGFLFLSAVFGFMQSDLAMKYQCRVQGQTGQRAVAPYLQKLLALNSTAKKLKIEELKAYAQLASFNPFLVAAAKARLLKVRIQKEQLDIKQKQLINQANIVLRDAFTKTRKELLKTQSSLSNLLFKVSHFSLQGQVPLLAVRPDYPDTAPTYSPDFEFAEKQSLAHEWQYTLSVRRPFSQFLSGEFQFHKACAVSLAEENSQWVPKIIRGKFSLKSVW
ncbi:MAG: hypothetical protein OM95_04785 [Bdellovibrio sp. ArHS]|uniref:hypothetical protein n=1 Tax=Bdellovibrio sp. ArHS TaxID=1569284 RepID=UPI0005830636|nr:hypothetical protein [Bdellovibrio sp. ArHS]KHD89145.1 MAG: hypothetical protein OM95_04785 [Bdellovibrio sp. ArHS]